MNRQCLLLLCLALAVFASQAEETNILPSVSVASETASRSGTDTAVSSNLTIEGYTYENVRWTRITPSTATMFHKTGVATIPLEKLPLDLQKKFGYDPTKAQQYRQAVAKARAEWERAKQRRDKLLQQQQAAADRLKKLEASAVDFHCKIMALEEKGVVVRTAKTSIPYSATEPVGGSIKDRPTPIEITYAFLVGHPHQASWAVGDTISCRAYRDGVQETDGDPLPRWVYVGEAHHPIPPPPPP
jgi:hypothetical protein